MTTIPCETCLYLGSVVRLTHVGHGEVRVTHVPCPTCAGHGRIDLSDKGRDWRPPASPTLTQAGRTLLQAGLCACCLGVGTHITTEDQPSQLAITAIGVPCRACEGTGKAAIDPAAFQATRFQWEDCDTCGGAGDQDDV